MFPRDAFDEEYYRRFYLNPATRVSAAPAQARLADFVFGYLAHLEVPVKRVLDLGCGLGQWRKELAKHHPKATYQGVEFSPYLCEKLGWVRGSVADYRGRGRYDLVICQSVFQYLDDAEAKAGIRNLARLCRGAVYLEIITRKDWREHCNREITDGNIHLREGAWYRKQLDRHFRSIGGGLFLPKDSPAVLYELEG
jgi:SAM-dependent methyltransferase